MGPFGFQWAPFHPVGGKRLTTGGKCGYFLRFPPGGGKGKGEEGIGKKGEYGGPTFIFPFPCTFPLRGKRVPVGPLSPEGGKGPLPEGGKRWKELMKGKGQEAGGRGLGVITNNVTGLPPLPQKKALPN